MASSTIRGGAGRPRRRLLRGRRAPRGAVARFRALAHIPPARVGDASASSCGARLLAAGRARRLWLLRRRFGFSASRDLRLRRVFSVWHALSLMGLRRGVHRGELLRNLHSSRRMRIVRRHPPRRRRASRHARRRARQWRAAGARASARRGRPAHGHVVLSVGHRTGVRALPHGPLSRAGRPAGLALVRPRRARPARFPDYTRSYVGYQMGAVDRDIDADRADDLRALPAPASARSASIGRGLPPAQAHRIDHAALGAARRAHAFPRRTSRAGSRSIARSPTRSSRRVRVERPDFVFAALTGVDKVSHARGQDSPMMHRCARASSTRRRRGFATTPSASGRWDDMHAVDRERSRPFARDARTRISTGVVEARRPSDDVASVGRRRSAPEVAVMVSGNAMAHLYLDVRSRGASGDRDGRDGRALRRHAARASVGRSACSCAAATRVAFGPRERGDRVGVANGERLSTTRRESGDPLGVGRDVCGVIGGRGIRRDDRHGLSGQRSCRSCISRSSPRSGEIILSAARDWDFRARYEPIPHVSSHGALHREHMLVPLLTNRPLRATPRRTVDVMPSALAALGAPMPAGLDGRRS